MPTQAQASGRLAVFLDGPGAMDVDVVSLFPAETYKNRPGGLRKDLGELLEGMHPGFIRFPGGCIVEGRYLDYRYQWKTTIGDPADRRLIINRWNDEFPHKPAPDYYQSYGLGFFEYFQLAEDIGAEPLPILNCGMACQFNSAELAPMNRLDQYIQDALDLVEFANGPVDVDMGQAPRGSGTSRAVRDETARRRQRAVGAGVSASLRGVPEGAQGEVPRGAARRERRSVHRSSGGEGAIGGAAQDERGLIDEHFYRTPDWFFQHASQYDAYPRSGSKIFVGDTPRTRGPSGAARAATCGRPRWPRRRS